MWILLLLLSVGPDQGQVKQVEKYVDKIECVTEAKRIETEFAKVYPGDESHAFVCIKQKEKEA